MYEAVPLQKGGAALIAVTAIRQSAQANQYLEKYLQQQQIERDGEADALGYLAQLRATAKVSKNPDAFQ